MINYIIIPPVLLLVCALSGYGIRHAIRHVKPVNSILTGFMFLIALFYFTAIPFLYTHGNAGILFIIYSAEVGLILICSAIIFVKNLVKNGVSLSWSSFFAQKISVVIMIICLLLIAGQMVIMVFACHTDIDDSFYIAQTTTILKSGLINPYEPSTGILGLPFQMQYAMVGHEVMYAYICTIFHVNAAALFHTVMPIFLIVIHYLILWEISKLISSKYASHILLLLILINHFSGYSIYSSGAFALMRMWQGKAVLVNIIMPFVFYTFIRIYKNRFISWQDVVFLFLAIIGGMYTSAVGVYVVPLSCAVFGFTYLIYLVLHKILNSGKIQFRNWFRLLIPAVLSVPFAAIIYTVILSSTNIEHLTDNTEMLSYADVLDKIRGTGFFAILFILAVLYMINFEKGFKRYVFGVYPAICFLSVLNPFICTFMAEYVTGTEVYWRLFWILPMNICVAACFISIIGKIRSVITRSAVGTKIGVVVSGIAYVLSAAIICFSGKYIQLDDNYSKAENIEKISSQEKEMSDAILANEASYSSDNLDNHIRLLIPEQYSYGVREYTGEIELAWSRYSTDDYVPADWFAGRQKLIDIIYNRNVWSDEITDLLKEYDINYIAFYKNFSDENGRLSDKELFSGIVWESDEMVVVKRH